MRSLDSRSRLQYVTRPSQKVDQERRVTKGQLLEIWARLKIEPAWLRSEIFGSDRVNLYRILPLN
jgi:hypothetical protein